MIINQLRTFFNPELFQGRGKIRQYFEGWYFKVVSADESSAFAFIPGIAIDQKGNKHSFIQVLDGKKQTAVYHRFDFQMFSAPPGELAISIGKNFFSEHEIRIDLPDLKADLHFSGNVPWPKPFYSPGIMGPFSFVPFLECYHGIVSMNHTITGKILVEGVAIDFSGGLGYTEKDWGKSFPAAYVWMQTNHFSKPGISLKTSVAKIPWLGSSFVGFIAGIWLHDKLIRFTTYNGSHLKKSQITLRKIELILENSHYRLELIAHRDQATELASPILGLMDGRIEESMTSEIEVSLYDKKSGACLLKDTGRNAGLEVAGRISEIEKI